MVCPGHKLASARPVVVTWIELDRGCTTTRRTLPPENLSWMESIAALATVTTQRIADIPWIRLLGM